MVLCEVPAGGRTTRYALPFDIFEFASAFDGARETTAMVRVFCARHPGRSQDHVERLVFELLQPRGLLVDPEDSTPELRRTQPKRGYMGIRLPILFPRVVTPICRVLGWLFTPWSVGVMVLPIVISQLWFFTGIRPAHDLTSHSLTTGDALAVMLLVSLGSLIHEFGHATAGVRYGCRQITIGWGIYIYFQVLYTDLSEVWRLPRTRRAVVDLGGIYFQLLYLVGVAVTYRFTHAQNLLYCFLFSDLAIAGYLSPILRLDGYWLLSDLLGIANLRQQSVLLFRRAVGRIASAVGAPAGPSERWVLGTLPTTVLAAYSAVSGVVFGGMWYTILRGFGVDLLVSYSGVLTNFWLTVTGAALTPLAILTAVFDIFWRTAAMLGLGITVYRGVRWITRALGQTAAWLAASLAAPRRAESV